MKIVIPPTKIRKKMSKVMTIQLQKSKFKKGNKEKRILKKGICNKFNKPCQEVAQSFECVSVEK